MQKLNSLLTRSLLICIALTGFISYASAQKKSIDKEFDKSTPYPSSFTEQKSGVLVVVFDKDSNVPDCDTKGEVKSLTQDLQKLFPDDYTGDYVFAVAGKDIEDVSTGRYRTVDFKFNVTNAAYQDVDKYRFILFSQAFPQYVGGMFIVEFKFGIYDRKTNTFNTTFMHSGSQKPLMETFVKKLEEVRVK